MLQELLLRNFRFYSNSNLASSSAQRDGKVKFPVLWALKCLAMWTRLWYSLLNSIFWTFQLPRMNLLSTKVQILLQKNCEKQEFAKKCVCFLTAKSDEIIQLLELSSKSISVFGCWIPRQFNIMGWKCSHFQWNQESSFSIQILSSRISVSSFANWAYGSNRFEFQQIIWEYLAKLDCRANVSQELYNAQ